MLERAPPAYGDSQVTWALRPELQKIAAPTLFVWGEKDPFGPPSLGEEMARMMPHARCEMVPETGHLPWLEEPQRCADLLRAFLAA